MMRIIEFSKEPERTNSYVGGGVFIDDANLIPKGNPSGDFMTHFMTLDYDFFPTEVLAPDHQVSIFLPANYVESESKLKNRISKFKRSSLTTFTIQDQEQYTENNGAYVLLHKKGEKEINPDRKNTLPKYYIKTRLASAQEVSEESEDDFIGLMKTKLYGRPGFLQDEVFESQKMIFCLQVFESDLVAIDDFYEGIFGEGAGYLFLNLSIKRQKTNLPAGLFFAQFT